MGKEVVYSTEDELLERARALVGKNFGEIDNTGRIGNNKGKGKLGQIIEESHFGYAINSKSEADFKDLNIELKVTPYKVNRNRTYSAKERLVLNIIDYMSEVHKDFYTSSFWVKNNKLLLVFYLFEEDKNAGEYTITNINLFEIPESDLPTIMQDWETIVSKIKQGKAHELSEGDTFYLGACTKGKNKNSIRQQPFSKIPAKQRAYSLKQSYMTYILRNKILGQSKEKLIKEGKRSIEGYVNNKLTPMIGKSYNQLCKEHSMDIQLQTKNAIQILMSKIFDIKGTNLSKIEEFEKANILIKTIRVENNNTVKESMSFPTFKFKEIIEVPWQESNLKGIFEEQKYLFLVFKKAKNNSGDMIFKGYKFWNIPQSDLKEVKRVYEKTVNVIKEGVKVEQYTTKNGHLRNTNNLPSKNENQVCHVRPHGANAQDTYELPDGRNLTKQCFWLNNSYIYEQIKDLVE